MSEHNRHRSGTRPGLKGKRKKPQHTKTRGLGPPGAWWTERKDDKANVKIEFHLSLLYDRTLPHLGIFQDKDGNLYQDIGRNLLRCDIPISEVPSIVYSFFKSSKLPNETAVLDELVRNGNRLGKNAQSFFPVREVVFLQDTSEYLFFACTHRILRIDRTTRTLEWLEYEDIDCFIDIDSVIDFDGELTSREDASNSKIAEFIKLVSSNESAWTRKFLANLGYMIDRHKHGAHKKAVVFIDGMQEEGAPPNGRSGKSLLSKMLGYVRKPTCFIDAQGLDPNNRFLFQTVDSNAQCVVLDDMNGNFRSDRLFSIISGDFPIERKNVRPLVIPAEISPRFLITSNKTVVGIGASNNGRFSILEFNNYFNLQHTPEDEWGGEFYTSWDQQEWNRFFTYVFTILIPVYLKDGIDTSDDSAFYRRNQVIQATSHDFFNWSNDVLSSTSGKMETYNLKQDCIINVGEKTSRMLEDDRSLFTRWVRIYVEQFLEATLTVKKSNGKNYLLIEE